ncbi:MAG: hypothetical protein R3C10_07890 [Pirellulales bacterium]
MTKLDQRNIEADPSRLRWAARRCGYAHPRCHDSRLLSAGYDGRRDRAAVCALKPADVHDAALAFAYDQLEEIESAIAADDEEDVKRQHTKQQSSRDGSS